VLATYCTPSPEVRFFKGLPQPFPKPMKPSSKHWFAFAALGMVWGSTWIAGDTLAESVPPRLGAAIRFLLAAVLCVPVVVGKRLRVPRGRALGFVLLLSVTMVVLPSVLVLWAQRHVSSVIITVLFSAMPLLVALFTPGEVPRGALLATVVGLGGIFLAMGPSFPVHQAGGAAVAFLAVASTGGSAVLARRELREVNPLGVTALLSGASALLFFIASIAFERGQPAQWSHNAIGSIVFLAVVAGAPAYAIYFWLLQHLEAYKVTTVQWIEPLVAILETAVFLRLGLSFAMIAGALVALASLLLVMRARAEDDKNVSLLGN
jgi:drug/metabolite transporter (DMT)-like permease